MRRVVRVMMLMAVLAAAAGLCIGCGEDTSEGGSVSDESAAEQPTGDVVVEEPAASEPLPLEDDLGRTPADAFEEHIAAVGTGDPAVVWNTYGCSPPADFDTWAMEWEDAAEVFRDVAVLEERVVDEATAEVRVVYTMRTGDDEFVVADPGEWWRIEKVDGVWKVGWLPRQ